MTPTTSLALGAAITAPFALHDGNLTLAIGCVLTAVVLPLARRLGAAHFNDEGRAQA
jgi:hypothetical protein